jgi:hypothetical protein
VVRPLVVANSAAPDYQHATAGAAAQSTELIGLVDRVFHRGLARGVVVAGAFRAGLPRVNPPPGLADTPLVGCFLAEVHIGSMGELLCDSRMCR